MDNKNNIVPTDAELTELIRASEEAIKKIQQLPDVYFKCGGIFRNGHGWQSEPESKFKLINNADWSKIKNLIEYHK